MMKNNQLEHFGDRIEEGRAVEGIGRVLAEHEMLAQPPGIGIFNKATLLQNIGYNVVTVSKFLERNAEREPFILMTMTVELESVEFTFVFQFELEMGMV